MMDVPVAGTHAIDLAAEPPLRVGHATIDPLSHEAEFGGHRERLQPQNLKVLIALARKRGQVVTRDELVQLCWDGRFIGDDVINRAISTLRQFAERAGGFTIETVPRAGYRLTDESAGARRHPRLWIAGSAMLLVACIAAVLIYAWPRRSSSAAPPTIALLPFSAATSEPQMHELASAMHDALAHTLSQGAFAVTVLDSMPQSRSPAADFVISGEVTANPEKIVTTVRMDETAHHYVVFSHQFEAALKDASGLPAEVGAQVAAQISWVEPLLIVERRHPTDPAIIASVLQSSAAGLVGTGLLNDYERSERLAVQAPNSPLAQASFANNTAFVLDELPREDRAAAVAAGRRAAERSLAIAPEFGAGYFAWSLLQNNLAWGAGEDKLRAGMRADPEAPFLDWLLSGVLNEVGRTREAFDLARLSLGHDPYMLFKIARATMMLEATGRTEEAERLYEQSVSWWPKSGPIVVYRLNGIAERGDFRAFRTFGDAHGDPFKLHAILVAIDSGSLPALHRSCAKAEGFPRTICLLGLARLRDLDAAYALAERVYPSRYGRTPAESDQLWFDNPDEESLAFITGPVGAPLRSDPRYLALAQRTGLLSYWRSGRLPDFCTDLKPEPICARIRER